MFLCGKCCLCSIHDHCLGASALPSPADPSMLMTWVCAKCDDAFGSTGHVELTPVVINDRGGSDGIGGSLSGSGPAATRDKGEDKKRKAKTVDPLQDLNALAGGGAGSGAAEGNLSKNSHASGSVAPVLAAGIPTAATSAPKKQKNISQILSGLPDMYSGSSSSVAAPPAHAGAKKGKPKDEAPMLAPVLGEDATDDYCFVCDEGGTLLLCDYPGCIRSYHQVCIWRTFPSSVDQGVAELAGEKDTASDDPWFCPVHHCSSCGVLEETPVPLAVLGESYKRGIHIIRNLLSSPLSLSSQPYQPHTESIFERLGVHSLVPPRQGRLVRRRAVRARKMQ